MISTEKTVGDLVLERPSRARVFEELGLDYCCGGGVPLQEACSSAGIDLDTVLEELAKREADPKDETDLSSMGLGELVDDIVQTHHEYLRSELPRLGHLVGKVEAAHGDQHQELHDLREEFERLRSELEEHTQKEEQMLFPACRELEGAQTAPEFQFGSVENPISTLMSEHVDSGEELQKIRDLTGGYAVPQGACNSYRAMLDGLAELERDTHYHIFKENSILFPKAVAAESALSTN